MPACFSGLRVFARKSAARRQALPSDADDPSCPKRRDLRQGGRCDLRAECPRTDAHSGLAVLGASPGVLLPRESRKQLEIDTGASVRGGRKDAHARWRR